MEALRSPWDILGIPENSADDIAKSAWRKLIVKCHPDKVTEDLREQKAEEFKQVNEAFKIITDPVKRKEYDDEQEARKRFRETGATTAGYHAPPPSNYTVRTAAPQTYPRPPPSREPTWEHGRSYDDDRYYEEQRTSSRKYDGYDSHSAKRSSPRTPRVDRENVKTSRESDRAGRTERRKTRDRDEKKERQSKFATVEDDSDERGQYEESYRRKSEEQRARDRYEESRRYDDVRRSDDKRPYRDKHDDRTAKYYSQTDEARDYMERSKQTSSRPSFVRRSGSSMQDTHVRRSAARRTSEKVYDRADRDWDRPRKASVPEIVDFPSDRRMPKFEHSASSPAGIKVGRMPAERSRTDYDRDDYHPAPPTFRRSETMPQRKRETTPTTSKLRTAETIVVDDSGYSSPSSPDGPQPTSATSTTPTAKYYYSPTVAGVSILEEPVGYANGKRTVTREPPIESSRRRKSPSPNRPTLSSSRTASARYTTVQPPPPIRTASYQVYPSADGPASASIIEERRPSAHTTPIRRSPPLMREMPNGRSPERDRDNRLFCEVTDDRDALRAAGSGGKNGSPAAYFPEKISYNPAIGRDDVKYSTTHPTRAGRPRGREAEYVRPSMSRSQTYAY